jgi:putative membrane protein
MHCVTIAACAFTYLVAALHGLFFVLEMFLWRTRLGGRLLLGMTSDEVNASWPVAANQGLSNAFLAAGLLWTAVPRLQPAAATAFQVRVFFLTFIVIAGVFGALTVNRPPRDRIRINYIFLMFQSLPAVIALVLTWISWQEM